MTKRASYLAVVLLLVAAAFAARLAFGLLYLPDLLTGAFTYLFLRAVFPDLSPRVAALAAFIFLVLVECSQLIHSPWIDAWRHAGPARFLLGQAFDPWDILLYAAGAVLARFADRYFWGD